VGGRGVEVEIEISRGGRKRVEAEEPDIYEEF
jgi:hypothetical protein